MLMAARPDSVTDNVFIAIARISDPVLKRDN